MCKSLDMALTSTICLSENESITYVNIDQLFVKITLSLVTT